jgi:hypothetical protein
MVRYNRGAEPHDTIFSVSAAFRVDERSAYEK